MGVVLSGIYIMLSMVQWNYVYDCGKITPLELQHIAVGRSDLI